MNMTPEVEAGANILMEQEKEDDVILVVCSLKRNTSIIAMPLWTAKWLLNWQANFITSFQFSLFVSHFPPQYGMAYWMLPYLLVKQGKLRRDYGASGKISIIGCESPLRETAVTGATLSEVVMQNNKLIKYIQFLRTCCTIVPTALINTIFDKGSQGYRNSYSKDVS